MSLKIIITYKTKINPDIFPPRLFASCLVSAIVGTDKGRAKCAQVVARNILLRRLAKEILPKFNLASHDAGGN